MENDNQDCYWKIKILEIETVILYEEKFDENK